MARKKAQALPRPEPEMWVVRGEIVQETEDAILLVIDEDNYWLPKSQITYDGERGDVVTVWRGTYRSRSILSRIFCGTDGDLSGRSPTYGLG